MSCPYSCWPPWCKAGVGMSGTACLSRLRSARCFPLIETSGGKQKHDSCLEVERRAECPDPTNSQNSNANKCAAAIGVARAGSFVASNPSSAIQTKLVAHLEPGLEGWAHCVWRAPVGDEERRSQTNEDDVCPSLTSSGVDVKGGASVKSLKSNSGNGGPVNSHPMSRPGTTCVRAIR